MKYSDLFENRLVEREELASLMVLNEKSTMMPQSAAEENGVGLKPRRARNNRQLLPFDSMTYTVPLDIWYAYYRFAMQLGTENDFADIATGQYPHISFYTPQEEERFIQLCNKLGVKYKKLSGKEKEQATDIKSPVASSNFRDDFFRQL